MKLILALALSLMGLIQSNSSFGFSIYPVIRESGQVLSVYCDAKTETACKEICNKTNYCEIKESYCRNCAGTQNIKLKRIFDAVGTTLVAADHSNQDLVEILKNGSFTSLHSMTIYNYSGQYDGDQVRAQFKYLCPNLSINSEKMGVLLLGLNPENNSISGVLGAICPDEKTGQSYFYKTNSRWQLP